MKRYRWLLLLVPCLLGCNGMSDVPWRDATNEATRLGRQGRYAEAALASEKAVHCAQQFFGPEHPVTIRSLIDLAYYYDNDGKHTLAERYYLDALRLINKRHKSNDPQLVTVLNNLGWNYDQQQRYVEAERYYRRVLDLQDKDPVLDDLDLARTYGNLATLYISQSRYAEAAPFEERALAIYQKKTMPGSGDLINCLEQTALIYLHTDDQQRATALFDSLLANSRRAYGEHSLAFGLIANAIGLYYQRIDCYEKAEPLFKSALSSIERTVGPDNLLYALALSRLGMVYLSLDSIAAAEPYLEQALRTRERIKRTSDTLSLAACLGNLGALYAAEGLSLKAELYYTKSLTLLQQTLGDSSVAVAKAYNDMAGLFTAQGLHARADSLYRHAIDICRAHDTTTIGYAALLDNYGSLRRFTCDYDSAEALVKRALAIFESAKPSSRAGTLNCTLDLALLYDLKNDPARAEPLYLRAVQIANGLKRDVKRQIVAALNQGIEYYQKRDRAQEVKILRSRLKWVADRLKQ